MSAMSFTAQLGEDVTVVEPGSSAPLTVEIANRSDERDEFEMELEGIDPEWTAVPVPTFFVEARETQSEKVFFKPPRASESVAGNYPFVLKVRSLVSGESKAVQGVLEVRPFHHLSAEINPKRGSVTPMRRQEDFDLTVMNLGNTEHTLQLMGNDPEDECAYAFEPEQVTVGPGQQKEVYVGVSVNAQKPFSGSRLFGFSVSARSVESPSVVCSAQAQLERKPILSPMAAIFGVLLLVLAIGWWELMPKPPAMYMLSVDPNPVVEGNQVTVKWKADPLSKVRLSIGSYEDMLPSEGERTFPATIPASSADTASADRPYSVKVTAVAIRDGKESEPKTADIEVDKAPRPPKPEIKQFTIQPKVLVKGSTGIVTYEFGEGVKKAHLDPIGLELDPNGNSATFPTPDVSTPYVSFTLVAEGDGNVRAAKKTIKVQVIEQSIAGIVKFDAYPAELPAAGAVTLSWQLSNAVRAEISTGTGPPREVDADKGTQEFDIGTTTTFTLTGTDTKGNTVTKKLTVKVAATTPPPDTGKDSGTPPGVSK